MVVVIKRGYSKKAIQKAMALLRSNKKLNAYKYCGVISLTEDPLEIQKKMRNEWQ